MVRGGDPGHREHGHRAAACGGGKRLDLVLAQRQDLAVDRSRHAGSRPAEDRARSHREQHPAPALEDAQLDQQRLLRARQGAQTLHWVEPVEPARWRWSSRSLRHRTGLVTAPPGPARAGAPEVAALARHLSARGCSTAVPLDVVPLLPPPAAPLAPVEEVEPPVPLAPEAVPPSDCTAPSPCACAPGWPNGSWRRHQDRSAPRQWRRSPPGLPFRPRR